MSAAPVTGPGGLVATSQPLASEAALAVLRDGGRAVDAAVTAAATLAVVEPTMTGVGGDLFALLYRAADGTLHALNASGRAPAAASLAAVADGMPADGIRSVTVPGAVDGWDRLLREHGTISLARALAPALEHAREGFTVTPVVARQWSDLAPLLERQPDAARTFLPDGRAPRAGETFRNPALASTLERLGTQGRDEFYEGATARALVDASRRLDGWLEAGDLAAHTSDWVEPLRTSFHGHDVIELPPNTQGVTAIEILNLVEPAVAEASGPHDPEYGHVLMEAVRIAFADRQAYLADPAAVPADLLRELVSTEYADRRRREIGPLRALELPPARADEVFPAAGPPATGDTVYLAVVDGAGNCASVIQSLYAGFGSGVVAGDTGVVLQNRGSLFSSDPTHPNRLAPGRRPLHTLIPALALRDGRPRLVFGVMGGDMQAQGHAQVLANHLVFGHDVQAAGALPRLRWTPDGVAVEAGAPEALALDLRRRGHRLVSDGGGFGFGGYQGIAIDADGTRHGGSDPRKDGCARAV